MTRISEEKLEEIIDVEFDGDKRVPKLMEIGWKYLEYIGSTDPSDGGVVIKEEQPTRQKFIPISDGTNKRFLVWEKDGERGVAKTIIEHFNSLNEGKEYKLFINEPPYSITEHQRRLQQGELIPRLQRKNDDRL